MHNFLKAFLFCFVAFFGLSLKVLGGANNQLSKTDSDANSSVATELNKLKESSALTPEERARYNQWCKELNVSILWEDNRLRLG